MEKAQKGAFAESATRCAMTAVMTGLSIALLALSTTFVEAQSRPPIVSNNTYGEWSGRWWQWAFENGYPDAGVFQTGAIDCSAGQSGSVWFLAGTAGTTGAPVVRQCTIKSGKHLFFPLVNIFLFNPDPNCPANNTCTVGQKRAITSGVFDGAEPGADLTGDGTPDPTYACDLSAEVDGIKTIFADHPIVRTQSPPFPLEGDPAAVSDGFWVMLPPLSTGTHKIHFKGALCNLSESPTAEPFFSTEVTYKVTVAP